MIGDDQKKVFFSYFLSKHYAKFPKKENDQDAFIL